MKRLSLRGCNDLLELANRCFGVQGAFVDFDVEFLFESRGELDARDGIHSQIRHEIRLVAERLDVHLRNVGQQIEDSIAAALLD